MPNGKKGMPRGYITYIGYDSPIHGTDGFKSPPKDLEMRIKHLAKGHLRQLGHDS